MFINQTFYKHSDGGGGGHIVDKKNQPISRVNIDCNLKKNTAISSKTDVIPL